MSADLHLHTHFSDGTYSPEELAGHARFHRFRAVALTDHDTIDGCSRMAAACEEQGIEFIPGVEITTELDGQELHMLAYFIDTTNTELQAALAESQKERRDRIRRMVQRLNELSIPLEVEAVFKLANCLSPGRPHIARALVAAGHCRNLDEAFERFLKRNRPAWVTKKRISARDSIELVHRAGGLAVMAHPGLHRSDEVIEPLVRLGMDGLECFYTRHSTVTVEHYLSLADQYGLLVTGGSDCHGMTKGKPLIGSIKVPYDLVERLKTARARHVVPTSSS